MSLVLDPVPTGATPASARIAQAWRVLASVSDPEIPVISVVDLGIVRDVLESATGLEVRVTPTYAGCPATHVIEADITAALHSAGLDARVVTTLAPPWTTDWISAEGRAKLQQYGIAPPGQCAPSTGAAPRQQPMQFFPSCPQCGSHKTELLSQFGSTPCKALYRCLACREPFDYFKPL